MCVDLWLKVYNMLVDLETDGDTLARSALCNKEEFYWLGYRVALKSATMKLDPVVTQAVSDLSVATHTALVAALKDCDVVEETRRKVLSAFAVHLNTQKNMDRPSPDES